MMMNKKKVVTIFIVNWNTSEIIQGCLDNIRELDNLTEVKVVVADNASTDDSVKKIENYAFVTLIRNKENIGVVKSVNDYIDSLDTPYFLLLHSDVVLRKDTVRKMISYIEEHRKIAALGCKLIYPDGRIFPSTFYEPKLKYLLQECLPYGMSKIIYKLTGLDSFYMKFWKHDTIKELDSVGNACVLIRKKAIDDVGNIPEFYSNWLIEMEWFRMMRQKGWEVVYYPNTSAYHYEKYAKTSSKKDLEYKCKGYVISDKLIKTFLYYYKRNFGVASFLLLKFLSLSFFFDRILRSWLISGEKERIRFYLAGIREVVNTKYHT